MSGPNSRALVAARESEERALMPPPPPRRRQVVLDEDTWTDSLEAIIERDYFPELNKLEGKVEWLEAVRSGNPVRMREAQEAFASRMAGRRPDTGASLRTGQLVTPRSTMARGWTPGTTDAHRQGKEAEPLDIDAVPGAIAAPPVSLDKFLATHTSEDNASFSEILQAENDRRGEQYRALAAPPGTKQDDRNNNSARITDGFGSTGQPSDRLITWKYEPKNALMYPAAQRPAPQLSAKEIAALKAGPPRAISSRNTRFRSGTGTLLESGESTPGGGTGSSTLGDPSAGGNRGPSSATPRFRGVDGVDYSVLATPLFDPGEATPLMTWGELGATPVRIDPEDLPAGGLDPSRFRIREASARERAAREMTSAATPRPMSSAMQAILAARGGVDAKRPGGTPSAAALAAGRRLSGKRGASSAHIDHALRASYARSGSHLRKNTPLHSRDGAWESAAATPRSLLNAGSSTPLHITPLRVVEDRAGNTPERKQLLGSSSSGQGADKQHLTADLLQF